MGTQLQEVIITDLATKGAGTKYSPMRNITKVFSKEGELIAEHDPSPETFVAFDLVNFARYCIVKEITEVGATTVHQWLDSIERKK